MMNTLEVIQGLNNSKQCNSAFDIRVIDHLEEIGLIENASGSTDREKLEHCADALRGVKPPYDPKFMIESGEAFALRLKLCGNREDAGAVMFDVGALLQSETQRDFRDGMSTLAFKSAQFYWRPFHLLLVKAAIAEVESLIGRDKVAELSESMLHHALSRCDWFLAEFPRNTTGYGKMLALKSAVHVALAVRGSNVEENESSGMASSEECFDHMENESDGFAVGYAASAHAASKTAMYGLSQGDVRGRLLFAETRYDICATQRNCPEKLRLSARHLHLRLGSELLDGEVGRSSMPQYDSRRIRGNLDGFSKELQCTQESDFEMAETFAVFLCHCFQEEDWLGETLNSIAILARHRDSMIPGQRSYARAQELIGMLYRRAGQVESADQLKFLKKSHLCWLDASGCFDSDSLEFSRCLLSAMQVALEMFLISKNKGTDTEDFLDRAIAFGSGGMENVDRIWNESSNDFRPRIQSAWSVQRGAMLKVLQLRHELSPSWDNALSLLTELTKSKNRTFLAPLFSGSAKEQDASAEKINTWEKALNRYWAVKALEIDMDRSLTVSDKTKRVPFLRRHNLLSFLSAEEEFNAASDDEDGEARSDAWSGLGSAFAHLLEQAEQDLIRLDCDMDHVESPPEIPQPKRSREDELKSAEARNSEMGMMMESLAEMLRIFQETTRSNALTDTTPDRHTGILNPEPKDVESFMKTLWQQGQSAFASGNRTLVIELCKLSDTSAVALIFPLWIKDSMLTAELRIDFDRVQESVAKEGSSSPWAAGVARLMRDMEELATQNGNPSPNTKFKNLDDLCEYLGCALRPIRDCIRHHNLEPTEVIFCPTDVLFYTPRHAAVWDEDKSWIDMFSVSYIPSLAMAAKSCDAQSAVAGRACVVGNPRCQASFSHLWPELLFAAEECKMVAAMMTEKGISVSPLKEEQATALAVRNEIESADIIHLAAHYEFSNDERCRGVVLADRILSAFELKRLVKFKPSCLVVASVCHGAVPLATRGDDILSLGQEFLGAGATSVITSLGSLDDQVGNVFASAFYQAYLEDRLPLNHALRKATLSVKTKFPKKEQWAKFVLIGQWDLRHLGGGSN